MVAIADEPTVKTYTFKIMDSNGVHLEADVHRPPSDAVQPVIVFIHGGALMEARQEKTPKARLVAGSAAEGGLRRRVH